MEHEMEKHWEKLPRPPDDVHICPLCCQNMRNATTYVEHVGAHLEHLALFVIPAFEDNPDESVGEVDLNSPPSRFSFSDGHAGATTAEQPTVLALKVASEQKIPRPSVLPDDESTSEKSTDEDIKDDLVPVRGTVDQDSILLKVNVEPGFEGKGTPQS
jgi:hypothetical protein